MRHRNFATDRCDIGDRPGAPFEHLRQNGERAVKSRKEIRVHHIAELLNLLILDWPHGDHTGIVDENVHSTKLSRRLIDQPFCLF